MPVWTRREWMRASAAGTAATLLPLESCDGAAGIATSLVLEAEPEGAVVAVWSQTAASAEVTVETPDGGRVGRWTVRLGDSGAGAAEVDGLAPATSYVARVATSDGAALDPHRFVTAPAPDDPRPQRITYAADIDPDPAYDSPIFDTLAAAAADLYVSLGDFPYADNPPAPTGADGFRARYVEVLTTAKAQAWLHATSMRAMYDDHEVRNDWDGATRASDPALVAAALGVWDEFFPLRGGAGPDTPRYRRWRWGGNVECFLLDTRRFRDPSAALDSPTKTMLGATQRAWLVAAVTASAAPFKLVFTTVPLDYGNGVDHWAGYPTERDAILDALADAGTPGVLFLSADQHWFAAQTHRDGALEFQVGPIARAPLVMPPLRPGVIARADQYNFGQLDVDAGHLRFRAIGAAGETLYDQTLTPDDLRLRRA